MQVLKELQSRVKLVSEVVEMSATFSPMTLPMMNRRLPKSWAKGKQNRC